MTRIAFLGVSHPHRYWWAEGIERVEDASLAGVHDCDHDLAHAFAKEYQTHVRTREDILQDPQVDFIIISGLNYQNAGFAMDAIVHGKPFLLEKPGARSAKRLSEVSEMARKVGARAHMGFILRYSPSVARARRLLDEDALGIVTLARFHVGMPAHAWQEEGVAAWFLNSENVSGPFDEDACHMVDILLHFFGFPDEVSAQWGKYELGRNSAEDVMVMTLRYPTLLAVVDFTAWEANYTTWDGTAMAPGGPWGETWGLELYGTQGTVRAGLNPPWFELYHPPGSQQPGWKVIHRRVTDQAKLQSQIKQNYYDYAEADLREGLAVAAGRKESSMSLDHGMQILTILEAAYRSCEEAKPILLP
jgi:predicted dehydrogenase